MTKREEKKPGPRRRWFSRLLLPGTVGLLIYWILYLWQPRPVLEWIAEKETQTLFYGETREKVVALTIDDGPHPRVTPQILDVLAKHGAKATFFIMGDRVEGNEALLDRASAEGHELANHLAGKLPPVFLGRDDFEAQLLEVDAKLDAFGPRRTKWFRPAWAWYSRSMQEVLERNGYRLALGSVYPHDAKLRSVALIRSYLLHRVFPGSIIVLHDGEDDRMRTAEVLEVVLPVLRERGYRVVTLGELANLDPE